MFHTHTVSGIVISFALFVIFYTGAFALFRDELYRWENHQSRNVSLIQVDTDELLQQVKLKYPDFNEAGQTSIVYNNEKQPYIQFYADLHSEENQRRRIRALVNPINWEITDNENPLTTVAETLYRLHFFDQIPGFGLWLSGFVSLFFLFAIVTGVLIHWKNLIQKFYAFSLKRKLKNIWTDAHTTLSIIGLPFQVTYAVTGALLGLLTLLLAPSAIIMLDGNTDPIFEKITPQRTFKIDNNAKTAPMISLTEIKNEVLKNYPDHQILSAVTQHYGFEDATIAIRVDDGQGIVSDGNIVYSLKDGTLLTAIFPNQKTYSQTVYNLMTKLHFGTFGGMFLKIVYFILSMITCFALISGILIWKTAREKKSYTDKQKRFHHQVTKWYLAICLSLFPATALLFLANKVVSFNMDNRSFYVNSIFFIGWLVFTFTGLFWNNLSKLNRNYLVIGSILSILVPILNGIVTKDWIWKTFTSKQYYVFSVDFSWLLAGIIGLLVCKMYLFRPKSIQGEN